MLDRRSSTAARGNHKRLCLSYLSHTLINSHFPYIREEQTLSSPLQMRSILAALLLIACMLWFALLLHNNHFTFAIFTFGTDSSTSIARKTSKHAVRIVGIMVARSEHWVLHTWLKLYAHEFDELVILDGSILSEHTRIMRTAVSNYTNIKYIHESEVVPALSSSSSRTDNSLRGIAWTYLDQSSVLGSWVVLAHADEFHLHDFRQLAALADRQRANLIKFKQFYASPHVLDKKYLEDGMKDGAQRFNIIKRTRYCAAQTYVEDRMFKYQSGMRWGSKHRLCIPERFPLKRPAYFQLKYLHFKIHNFDRDALSSTGLFTHSAWSDIPQNMIRSERNKSVDMYSVFGPGDEGSRCKQQILDYCSSDTLQLKCANQSHNLLRELLETIEGEASHSGLPSPHSRLMPTLFKFD